MQEQELILADDHMEKMGRWMATEHVLADVHNERAAQFAQWGIQNVPLGTGSEEMRLLADAYRKECQKAAAEGTLTYSHILLEEVFEALAEADLPKLRDELIQVAAVAVAAVEQIDRRATAPEPAEG